MHWVEGHIVACIGLRQTFVFLLVLHESVRTHFSSAYDRPYIFASASVITLRFVSVVTKKSILNHWLDTLDLNAVKSILVKQIIHFLLLSDYSRRLFPIFVAYFVDTFLSTVLLVHWKLISQNFLFLQDIIFCVLYTTFQRLFKLFYIVLGWVDFLLIRVIHYHSLTELDWWCHMLKAVQVD